MVAVRARASRQGDAAFVLSADVGTKLARPSVDVCRQTGVSGTGLEPEVMAAAVEGSKEGATQVDMSLEMVDVGALDTGQYQAMIIQDPMDKRNVKGFLHLARAYSINTPPEEAGSPYPDLAALPNLIQAFNHYTDIKADIVGTYTLDSQELLKTPFVMISCHVGFGLSARELLNLGRYLDEGGFLLSDDCSNHFGGPSDHALRTMIRDALDSRGFRKGLDWTWEILPKDHPIYHCYFDFDGAPRTPWTHASKLDSYPECPEPEGITLHGRLVAMHSTWDIGCGWEGPKVYPECTGLQHHRLLQLGINMLIFAMTQEGSITHRILSGLNY
jgi:hypothetical protein